ncbi:MAG: hydroxymethylbilane synthase [Senegalia sp. (in: firmicutes)]|uniref:hydroxymethylbilane synthase n=1 Tax=Senegalia sp. (in: firmicutes) TaxID=1924098 RepID=UPI003F961686
MKIKIGSRGSKLALTQSKWVVERLKEKNPNVQFEIQIIQTKGDKFKDMPLQKINDKGLFVKELENALLDEKIDIAIHSMKDMPSALPSGLKFTAIPEREDPRDVLILKEGYRDLDSLPKGAKIGTGSKRRKYQLLEYRNDLEIVPIRGNIETRIAKIESENLHGVILAAAGIHRLGLQEKISMYLPQNIVLPSPSQGALAIEIREDDEVTLEMISSIACEQTCIQVEAERAFLKGVNGGCHSPIGAYASIDGDQIRLDALFGDEDGKKLVRKSKKGRVDEAEKLGLELAQSVLKELKMTKDKVYLIGAGPGDVGLITVKGMEKLKEADVVIYDRLINDDLLKNVKASCELIYAGKKPNKHTMKQDEINKVLVDKAKEGKVVVRLKGGDPYVFGRGSEEGEELHKNQVEFEVIPGITSAIGGLTYAGIPITARNISTSFHVFTGHFSDDEKAFDFESIAKLNGTLVFLMGMKNLEKITKGLMEKGKDPSTPVAIINWATTASQKVITERLDRIYEYSIEKNMKPPSLIVIGDVVDLREKLNFFEKKILIDKDIVVTRPRKQNDSMIKKLKEYGANPVEFPTIKIKNLKNEKLKNEIKDIEKYNYIIFTSNNAVEIFFDELYDMGYDARWIGKAKIVSIGKSTTRKLSEYGIRADLTPETYLLEELYELLKNKVTKDDNILLPRSEKGRKIIVEQLNKISNVCEVHTYTTVADDSEKENLIEKLNNKEIDYITFTSSSTVENFFKIIDDINKKLLNDVKIISIGPITTSTINEFGFDVYKEASEYTIDGMIDTIIKDIK